MQKLILLAASLLSFTSFISTLSTTSPSNTNLVLLLLMPTKSPFLQLILYPPKVSLLPWFSFSLSFCKFTGGGGKGKIIVLSCSNCTPPSLSSLLNFAKKGDTQFKFFDSTKLCFSRLGWFLAKRNL